MLVATRKGMYDAKGHSIGYQIIEVPEAYTYEEAQKRSKEIGCPECGGIGEHNWYFVRTGQNGAGSVEGYSKQCQLSMENTNK